MGDGALVLRIHIWDVALWLFPALHKLRRLLYFDAGLRVELQAMTTFDPSPSDPRIVAALAAREHLLAMFAMQDAEGLALLLADDLVVHAPHNAVADRASVLGFFRSGLMNYEDVETALDFVGVRGDKVVIMGLEVVRPQARAANTGKTVRRRFTDIWTGAGEDWRLFIRQATIIAVE